MKDLQLLLLRPMDKHPFFQAQDTAAVVKVLNVGGLLILFDRF
jgi:hypothetical protein